MEIPKIPLNKDITYLGLSTFRDKNVLFGIKRKDRRQHVYVLGKSGTGKSVLMFNMIIQNIQNGEGVCVVDPHGELVEGVLSAIPEHRMKDVIYFNPADTDYHVGFNVLELEDAKYKHLVASGLMGIFTKIWANAWSARMEYILNNCILALLDTPGSTLLGIPRMLVDKDYRKKILANLKDPVIKAFWIHEYEAWNERFRNEAIAPIQNKVGQFLSSSIIRNVVGQSKSTVNVFDIMNEGKIFLVNVSKGRIGEDNSSLLGGMIITKVQLAAMERVRIPEDERRDFYLYVDEFQNFVTDAFAGILSEARKYRLNLTIAHQYTAQLTTKESSAMRDAVFGNVGTMIIFRVGADDAEFLEKEFEPEFTQEDIVNLPNYKIYLKLMIDGVTSRPFSARTLPPMVKSGNKEVEEEVIKSSRELYCRSKEEVEKDINEWSGMKIGEDGEIEIENSKIEKFPAVCSICKKETTVPFKPEPGRNVYCKECVAKIKSGEIQALKNPNGVKKKSEEKNVNPQENYKFKQNLRNSENKEQNKEQNKEGVSTENITRVFYASPKIKQKISSEGDLRDSNKSLDNRFKFLEEKSNKKKEEDDKSTSIIHENLALKELLKKTLKENEIFEKDKKIKDDIEFSTEEPKEIKIIYQKSISLDSLKQKTNNSSDSESSQSDQLSVKPLNDRAASQDDMNKLKNLIMNNASSGESEISNENFVEEKNQKTIKESPSIRDWQQKIKNKKIKGDEESIINSKNREIPEDVLMKILE